jgi:hypothetical protein
MSDGVLFPYLEVKNILGETAWRPILPFTLIYHGNSLEARGIIVSAQVASFSPVQLAFAWTRAEHVPMLLGQINFLREFNVCFFGKQKEFELQLRATT